MKSLKLYTDGSCKGNPGYGGWGAVLLMGDKKAEFSDYAQDNNGKPITTTNNRMELTAVIEGLCKLKESCNVEVISDSQYVINAFNKKSIFKWEKDVGGLEAHKNGDLWHKLMVLSLIHNIEWTWVRGHNGSEYNERCDKLAKQAIERAIDVYESISQQAIMKCFNCGEFVDATTTKMIVKMGKLKLQCPNCPALLDKFELSKWEIKNGH